MESDKQNFYVLIFLNLVNSCFYVYFFLEIIFLENQFFYPYILYLYQYT